MKNCSIMSIKSSLNKVSNIHVLLLIFLVITERECWPVFKQDPLKDLIDG